MNRMYSPSPTVRSSPIPLYLRGFPALLGQDTLDPTLFDPIFDPGIDLTPPTFPDLSTPILLPDPNVPYIDPTIFDPTGPLVYTGPRVDPNTQDIANLYAGAIATGTLTPAQAASAAAAAASAAARAATGGGATTVGPSPRISTRPPGASAPSFFTQQSIRGVPNWALFAAGAAALLAMTRR